MKNDPDFERLCHEGDPLEMLICGDFGVLCPVLLPYARVWSKHIYPRRIGDGSSVPDEWMPFAGNHYTALIRLHHAYRAFDQLMGVFGRTEEAFDRTPELTDYQLLLEAHLWTGTFWENLGAAIDNLDRAWDAAFKLFLKGSQLVKIDDKPPSKNDSVLRGDGWLDYAYARRNQLIHHAVVPKNLEDGVIVFNPYHYAEETTSWIIDFGQNVALELNLKEAWENILPAFAAAWEKLSSWLQSKDSAPPPVESAEVPSGVLSNFINSYSVPDGPPSQPQPKSLTDPSGSQKIYLRPSGT